MEIYDKNQTEELQLVESSLCKSIQFPGAVPTNKKLPSNFMNFCYPRIIRSSDYIFKDESGFCSSREYLIALVHLFVINSLKKIALIRPFITRYQVKITEKRIKIRRQIDEIVKTANIDLIDNYQSTIDDIICTINQSNFSKSKKIRLCKDFYILGETKKRLIYEGCDLDIGNIR